MSDEIERTENNESNETSTPETTASSESEGLGIENIKENGTSNEQSEVTSAESKDTADENAANKGSEDKIVFTKDQFDEETTKIRRIAEKKARRAAERELETKYQGQSQQMGAQQNQQAPGTADSQPTYPAPDSNHTWDPYLKTWIPTQTWNEVNKYLELANGGQQTQQNQQVGQQYSQPTLNTQNAQPQVTQNPFSQCAEDQATECEVRISDFRDVMNKAPVSPTMANSASVNPEGMKNLYQMMKTNPNEIYKISQLPVADQQHRMWLMNQKFAEKKLANVKSKATPQEPSLSNNGDLNKQEGDLSFRERKARAFSTRSE